MGRLDTDQDLARSKYVIIAAVAAIGMVLGAMSVGAMFHKNAPNGKNPVLSQIYPIPVNDNGDGDPSSGKKGSANPEQITPSFTSQHSIPLSAHQDWGKKALLTDPVNLQVRVGLTQAGVQVNALGLTVGLPPVNDVLQGVTGVVDDLGGTAATTPSDGSASTGTDTGSSSDQTPPSGPDSQSPPAGEQASTFSPSSELTVTP